MILISFLRWHNTRLSSTKPFCLFIVYSGGATERQLEGLEWAKPSPFSLVLVLLILLSPITITITITTTTVVIIGDIETRMTRCIETHLYDVYCLLAHINLISLCIISNKMSIWVSSGVCLCAPNRKSNIRFYVDTYCCSSVSVEKWKYTKFRINDFEVV